MDSKLLNELLPDHSVFLHIFPVLWGALVLTFSLFTLIWAWHVRKQDAGVIDFVWGAGFALIAWFALWRAQNFSFPAVLLVGLVTLWAGRLTVHMVGRHRTIMQGEDPRYRAMRQRAGAGFWWTSLFTVFWLQAALQYLLATPFLIAILTPQREADPLLITLGLVLFTAGFVIETLADWQLNAFRRQPANRDRLFTGGLFSWSRHPNYFGEALLWWGFGIISLAISGLWWVFLSPLLLTLFLLKVSGVTLLDAHLAATKPGFREWAARTSAFVPLPPRRGGVGGEKT